MERFKQIDCFKRHLKIWKLLGIYPLPLPWPYLYAIYSKIIIFTFLIMYCILFTINLYFLPKHLDSYIEELILYFTSVSATSKVLVIALKKREINVIINIVESDIFQPKSEKAVAMVNKAKRFNEQYWKIYITVCSISNVVHLMSPLLKKIILKGPLMLPVSSYSFLPDDIKNSFIYSLFFYQCIGMHLIMLSTVNVETFFIGIMNLLIAQLEILGHNLINITEDFKGKAKSPQNNAALISRLNKELKYYDDVRKFCSDIEDVFSVTVFVQFGLASAIISICLIRFTMPAPWQYYIFLSTYTFAMVVQISVPCWFGTRIMDKSFKLTQAIYGCDWTTRSQRFRSSMRLLIERASRPLSFTGMKMFPLSLMTFTSIINTTYSFFTLLRNMQSR